MCMRRRELEYESNDSARRIQASLEKTGARPGLSFALQESGRTLRYLKERNRATSWTV